MRRYCLTLDLKDDLKLIEEYIEYHKNVWPEIKESIKNANIHNMEIYRYKNRLCMIMEVDDCFSFERKEQMDAENEKVQGWEELMSKYQQQLPDTDPGKKWMLMDRIFSVEEIVVE